MNEVKLYISIEPLSKIELYERLTALDEVDITDTTFVLVYFLTY